jgi:predicted lipoprotein with Yx(FWY)xxD motif
MSNRRLAFRPAVVAALATIALVVAACSSSSAATTAPSAAAPAPSAAAPAPSTAAPVAVNAGSGTVGAYLTGPNGMTLYTLKTDSAGTSTCSGACAQNWPPFTTTSGSTFQPGSGVSGTLATFARADGGKQVTYNGAPLYYFAGDKAAGDTAGQGVGGKWYVASPSGAAPAVAPSASAAY